MSNLNRIGAEKSCSLIVTGALLMALSMFGGCSLWTVNSALSQLCDGDCAADEVCVNGRCAVATTPVDLLPTCVEDSDCGPGEQCLNDECVDREACVNGTCSGNLVCSLDGFCEEPTPCAVDTECDDGVTCNGAELCNLASGFCESGITTCVGEAPYCNVDEDICVECVGDANCDNGLFCDGVEFCDSIGTCIDGAEPCLIDCNDTLDICLECEFRSDCLDEDKCDVDCSDAGFCVPPSLACPALCDFPNGDNGDRRCLECKDDSDCEDGLRCDGIQTCDVETDTCVTVEDTAAPCADDDDKPQCKEVVDGGPGFECITCIDDADCDDLDICNGAERCVEGGLCEDEFDGNDTICSAEDVLDRCVADTGDCVECIDDDDCGDNDRCTEDSCNNNVCSYPDRCDADEVCYTGFGTYACGACVNDNQCPDDGNYCTGEPVCRFYVNLFGQNWTACENAGSPCDESAPFCNNQRGCYECRVDTDCPNDNNACNGVTTCNTANGSCQTSRAVSCTLPEVCNPINGQCAAP